MPGLAGNTRALPKAVRAQRGKTSQILWTSYGLPMDFLWTPYGLPMDSLWTSYGTTPSQHRALPRPSPGLQPQYGLMPTGVLTVGSRSEERRVGKERKS